MIVPSMKEAQLIDELDRDLVNVMAVSDEKDKKVTRIVRKTSVFPIYLHSFITTKLKNKWMILWEAKCKKNIGDMALITLICYFDTSHGKYAIMFLPTKEMRIWVLYTPHFFQRFANRMNINLTGVDLMKRYFEKNNNYGLIFEDVTKPDGSVVKEIYANSLEGAGLGIVHPAGRIFLLKTFITYDMCKGNQIEDFAKINQMRSEIHEKEMSSMFQQAF